MTFERDERSAVNPTGRKLYRFQVQGPTALEVLEKVTGGPLPEIKFFNMGRAHDRRPRGARVAPRHVGRARPRALRARWPRARTYGLRSSRRARSSASRRSARSVYATNTLESGWIPCPLPAIFTGDEMKAYREWLPANGYEGTGSLGGSFYSDDIEDYYLTPYELGYGPFVKFDHDFIGREALEKMARPAKRQKVTLAWNGEDVAARDGDDVPARRTGRSTSTCRSPTTRRGRTTRC